jgi:hypothetical protein
MRIDEVFSNDVIVKSVPQGVHLKPFLFIIILNYLSQVFVYC